MECSVKGTEGKHLPTGWQFFEGLFICAYLFCNLNGTCFGIYHTAIVDICYSSSICGCVLIATCQLLFI